MHHDNSEVLKKGVNNEFFLKWSNLMNIVNLMIVRDLVYFIYISNVKNWWIILEFDDAFVFIIMDVMIKNMDVDRFLKWDFDDDNPKKC